MATTMTPMGEENVFLGRWVTVKLVGRCPRRKTALYEVITNEDQQIIADIKWYGHWRQYALFPRLDTVWEPTCLAEMATCLTQLTTQHRQKGTYASR